MLKEQQYKYVIFPESLKLSFTDSEEVQEYTFADWVAWLAQNAEEMVDTNAHMRMGAYLIKQINEATMNHWAEGVVPHVVLYEDVVNYFTKVIEGLGQDKLPPLGHDNMGHKISVPLLKNLEFIDAFVEAKNVPPDRIKSESEE